MQWNFFGLDVAVISTWTNTDWVMKRRWNITAEGAKDGWKAEATMKVGLTQHSWLIWQDNDT